MVIRFFYLFSLIFLEFSLMATSVQVPLTAEGRPYAQAEILEIPCMGWTLLSGVKIEDSQSKRALLIYTKAKEGHAESEFDLAEAYESGLLGFPRDFSRARYFYGSSLLHGYENAKKSLDKLNTRINLIDDLLCKNCMYDAVHTLECGHKLCDFCISNLEDCPCVKFEEAN
jgi:TPR repeat protein